MNIQGLYRLTLLDYPGHVACSIFTGGCNYRCPFCHNASLATGHTIPAFTEEEILQFLQTRIGILEGVCVTGGEPTLQPQLPSFLRKIKDMGYLIKLDTNGSNPILLQSLIKEGLLDYVAMDIKNSPSNYAKSIGLSQYDIGPVLASIKELMSSNIDYEFRTTVVRSLHTPQDFEEIAKLISNCRHYYLQSFVDSGDLIQAGMTGYSKEEMNSLLMYVRPLIPNVALRGIE